MKEDYKAILNIVETIPNIIDSLNHKDYQNLDAWSAYRIGEAYSKFYLYEASLAFYKKSCNLAPFILDFNLKLAGAYFNLNKYDLAQKQYEFIINEFSKNEVAYCNLAYILMIKGDLDTAMDYLNISRNINPRHIQTLLNMSSCNMFANNVKLAEQNLLDILEIEPNNSKAIYLLDQIK